MDAAFDLDTLPLVLLFVLPGLISMQVYRLVLPSEKIDWSNAILQGGFFSAINYAILSPLIWAIHQNNFPTTNPKLYVFGSIFVLVIAPILWPIIVRLLLSKTRLLNKLQLPFPSAWDYYFSQRRTAFVLLHLKDGGLIGGYYGRNSYATSFPHNGEIYLETIYKVNDDGTFGDVIASTDGAIFRRDEYYYLELFKVPSPKPIQNQQSANV